MSNRPVETFKSEGMFQKDMLLYVNRASEDFNSPMHDHDFIEFAYIAEGNGFHHVFDQVHEVSKGQLCYIPIGTPHVFRPISANLTKHPLTVFNCVFSPRLLTKLGDFVSDGHVKAFISALHEGAQSYFHLAEAGDSIEKLFVQLHREYSLPLGGSADYLHALLLQLLIVVNRGKHVPHSPPIRKFSDFDHLLTYMERNLSQELSLARLAQISRWSERHLQRLFMQHTSQSFNRYLQSLRVRRSCELLRNSTFKVNTIAEMTGYKDIASFLTVFKRIAGMTPSAYRKAHSRVSDK
ncbi:AraC family transcriptional regulator [Cohnella herbarum]|uniref:Helix-turn-helix transcriptional regulator n=1 Tax=Cohnella herbarum TaxID=2728023 RepID=A0A7Z2VPQ7_9BACL|nr:AraC family transcriptional regulator [Cohnella herbarum]QJD87027.1 helix-turn-helix transcriptional regulator [Cohnella herbarum]